MNEAIFNEGFSAYDANKRVYEANPYRLAKDWGDGIISFQPETTWFYNGWESAARKARSEEGYYLFLDDFRFPHGCYWVNLPKENWMVARHYYDFVEFIEKYGMPKLISFDYDLDRHSLPEITAKPYFTGLDCAKWLVERIQKNRLAVPAMAIHSQNPEGPKKIYEELQKLLNKS